MAYKFPALALISVAACALLWHSAHANPAIAVGYDPLEICIENCAQCKKMLGAWFEGPLCVQYCIREKGRLLLDCENYASIAPFLNRL